MLRRIHAILSKKKGQAMIEFACVLPFYLLMMLCIFYAGLLFKDYLTLNYVVRDSARRLSLNQPFMEVQRHWTESNPVSTSFYDWALRDLSENGGSPEDTAAVSVVATLNEEGQSIARMMQKIGLSLPSPLTIGPYYMQRETMAEGSADGETVPQAEAGDRIGE